MPAWTMEIKQHILADHPIRQGLPNSKCVIRCDGQLIATVYPVEAGGIGVQVASDVLDFDEPIRIEPQAGAPVQPAVVFLRQGEKFPWPTSPITGS